MTERRVLGLPVTEEEFEDGRVDELFQILQGGSEDLYNNVILGDISPDDFPTAILGIFPTVSSDGSIKLDLVDLFAEEDDVDNDPNTEQAYLRATVDVANSLEGFTGSFEDDLALPRVTGAENAGVIDSMKFFAAANLPSAALVFYGLESKGSAQLFYPKDFPFQESMSQVLGVAASQLITTEG